MRTTEGQNILAPNPSTALQFRRFNILWVLVEISTNYQQISWLNLSPVCLSKISIVNLIKNAELPSADSATTRRQLWGLDRVFLIIQR